MKTTIEWQDPKINPPPFGRQFLALLGGQGSTDCLRTVTPYVKVANVVMRRDGPNCDDDSDYREFMADERGSEAFDDYQFHLVDFDQYTYGDDSDCLDWYSDSIVAWAPMPDFSALLAEKRAEAI